MDAVRNNGEVLLQGGGQHIAVSPVSLDQEQQTASVTAVAEPIFSQKQQSPAPSAPIKTAPITVTNPPACSYIDRAVGMVKEDTFPAGKRIEAYILIATAKAASGDTQGALAIFDKAQRSIHGDNDCLYPIIDALIEQGDVDSALHALNKMPIHNKKLDRLFDKKLDRLFTIAEAIAKKGDLDRALSIANQGVEARDRSSIMEPVSLAGILREGIKQNKITEKEAIEMVVAFQDKYKNACHSVDDFLLSIAKNKAEEGDIIAALEVVKKFYVLYSKRRATHLIIKIAAHINVDSAIALAAKNSAPIKALVTNQAYNQDMRDRECGTESAKAKLVIVNALIEKGDIIKAIEVSKDIDPSQKNEKNEAMAAIVKAYAVAGEIDRARNFAREITIDYIQDQAEMDILRARVEVLNEKITIEMLDALSYLQSNSLKSAMLQFFIEADPSKENLDKAEMRANSIGAWRAKAEVKISLVKARLNDDDFDGAERTASEMADSCIKDDARKEIALAYLKAGSFNKAIDTYRLITSITSISKCKLLISIAEFCIENNKNIDQVISIAKTISDSEWKNKVLIAIVKALLKHDMLSEAGELAENMDDPLTQVDVLIEMDKYKRRIHNGCSKK